jgi:hypothetical protein
MSIEWKLEKNNLVLIHVSGKLGIEEHRRVLSEIESIIQKAGKVKLLILLNDFEGWKNPEDWEKVDELEGDSAMDRMDPHITKFAIVGEEQWRDRVSFFTLKGLRPVPIEYFTEDQEEAARQWLDSNS